MLSGGFSTVESVSWTFDPDTAAMVLSIIATDKVDWDKDDGNYRWVNTIAGAGFYPPEERKRDGTQDSRVPWSNDPHRFSCHVTTIHLPKADSGWAWSHNSKAMDQTIGGIAYWRMADLTEGTMRTVMASRTVSVEISSEQAEAANKQIPGFDNSTSQVYQRKGRGESAELEVADKSVKEVPTALGPDWVKDASACIAPRLRN
jgi:hypothetical protein